MVALRGMVVMPEMAVHFDISRRKSIEAIQESMKEEQKIFLSAQKSIDIEEPGQEDIYEVGTIATIRQIVKLPKQIMRIMVIGEGRAILKRIESEERYLRVEVEEAEESGFVIPERINAEAMLRGLKDMFVDYASKNGKIQKDQAAQILEIQSLKKLVDEVAAVMPLYYTEQQELLGELNFWKRYELLTFKLVNEVQIIDIKNDIRMKVKERVDKHQREYILREEMKLIREELGDDDTVSDAEEFDTKVKELNAPSEVKEKLKKEIKRFKSSMNSPSESGVIRTYIETLLEMPWENSVEDNHDLAYVGGEKAWSWMGIIMV